MSILTITPNLEKKTAKFKGTVAAGEHVSVSIENASEISTSGLRLRVIDYSGNTLAMFPEPSLEEGMDGVGDWGGGGSVLTCELSLNTAPMHKAVCGMCEREFTVVLDNVAEKELHFVGQHTFLGWPKEIGSDIPYDFGEYPKLIDDWTRQIDGLTLTASRDDAEGKVEITVWNGRGGTEPVVVTIYDGDTSKVEEFARQAALAANAAAGSASEAKTALAAADTKIAAAKSEAVSSANSHSDGELQKHKTEADGTFATKAALDETNTNLTEEVTRAKAAETAINEKAQDALDKYALTLSTAQAAGIKAEEAAKAALDAVSKIIGGAPEALDTLKEIADWIAEDKTGTQAIVNQVKGLTEEVTKKADTTAVANLLNGKVDKVFGKSLSTNDYTTAEKEKLAGIDLTPYAKKTDLEGFATEEELLSFYYPDGNVTSMEQITTNGIEYAVGDDGGAYVVSGNNLSGHVVLPWKVTIDGTEYKVTAIGASAFDADDHENSFTSFTAPITVKSTGLYSFYNCSSLTSVNFPSATNIGGGAFYNCDSLTSVSLPSATRIGDGAFSNCYLLESVNFPSVTRIGDGAFADCGSLTTINLPSVTSIGNYAFAGCSSLSMFDFGSSPKSSIPTLGDGILDHGPISCRFIIPIGMYDEWIAADGWKDLYAQGYKFEGYASTEQVKDKRDKTDNVAVADSVAFKEWKFHCAVPEIQAALDEDPPVFTHYDNRWHLEDLPEVEGYYPGSAMSDQSYNADATSVHFAEGFVSGSGSGVPVSATRERTVITKSGEPYVTPAGVKNIAIPKYEFATAAIVDGKVTVAPYGITKVIVDDSVSELTFVFPEKTKGQARDFFVRLVVTGETVPTLSFVEPNGDAVSFDVDDDNWADIEQGVNILMFTDTAE